MFASTAVRKEYRHRNYGHDPSVRGNDVAFAIHVSLCDPFVRHTQVVYSSDFVSLGSHIITLHALANPFL